MRVFERKSWGLVLLACLLAAAPAGAAQSDAARKRAAVRRLVEVTQTGAASARVFDELIKRYQKNWADSVITDFRSRGLFKPYPDALVPRIEQLIREMGDNTFGEIRRRAASELYTDEFMVAVTAPPLEKLLTAEELESFLAFCETPAGRKLVSTSSRLLADVLVESFEERGFFNLLPSPEAESARIDRLTAEMRANPPVAPERLAAAWRSLPPDHFTDQEKLRLLAFAATPAASKLAGNLPQFLRELMENVAPHTPRVGQMVSEVFDRRLQEFAAKLNELAPGPARGGARGGGGRRRRP